MNSRLGVTATADLAVLLSELEALRAGSLASSGVGPCDVPFRYTSGPIPRQRGTVSRHAEQAPALRVARPSSRSRHNNS